MTTLNSILFYTVFIGRMCGIKKDYYEAVSQVTGYPGGFYEVYVCIEDAILAIERFTGIPYYNELDFHNLITDANS